MSGVTSCHTLRALVACTLQCRQPHRDNGDDFASSIPSLIMMSQMEAAYVKVYETINLTLLLPLEAVALNFVCLFCKARGVVFVGMVTAMRAKHRE